MSNEKKYYILREGNPRLASTEVINLVPSRDLTREEADRIIAEKGLVCIREALAHNFKVFA